MLSKTGVFSGQSATALPGMPGNCPDKHYSLSERAY